MTRNEVREMIMDILGQADYDLAKSYDPETAEDPEYTEKHMQKLIDIANKHINEAEYCKSMEAFLKGK